MTQMGQNLKLFFHFTQEYRALVYDRSWLQATDQFENVEARLTCVLNGR